jgi:hypothetical protein
MLDVPDGTPPLPKSARALFSWLVRTRLKSARRAQVLMASWYPKYRSVIQLIG